MLAVLVFLLGLDATHVDQALGSGGFGSTGDLLGCNQVAGTGAEAPVLAGRVPKLVKLLPPFLRPHLLTSFPQLPRFGQTGVQGCEPLQLPMAFAQLLATSVPLGDCVVLSFCCNKAPHPVDGFMHMDSAESIAAIGVDSHPSLFSSF